MQVYAFLPSWTILLRRKFTCIEALLAAPTFEFEPKRTEHAFSILSPQSPVNTGINSYLAIWLSGTFLHAQAGRPGCPAFWLSGYLAIWLAGCQSTWRRVRFAIWLSGYLAIWLSGYLAIWLSGYQCACLSIFLSVGLSACLVYLAVCRTFPSSMEVLKNVGC